MTNPFKVLGITDQGTFLLGGFFTAHDQCGFPCEVFIPHAHSLGYEVSIPYFFCENLRHENRDPDAVWPMLEIAFQESKRKVDWEVMKVKTEYYLAYEWTKRGKPTLKELAESLMSEMEKEGQNWKKVFDFDPKL